MEGSDCMEMAVDLEVMEQQEKYESEVRNLVLAGYNQAKSGKTQDFNEVCDRLEKKYQDAVL